MDQARTAAERRENHASNIVIIIKSIVAFSIFCEISKE